MIWSWCLSVKQTNAHDGSKAKILNECSDQSWLSMKQTTVHNGGSSKKPGDWCYLRRLSVEITISQDEMLLTRSVKRSDLGQKLIKQMTDCVGYNSRKPNDWNEHGKHSMRPTTDVIGCISITPNRW